MLSGLSQKNDTIVAVAKYAPDLPSDFEGATKLATMPPYLAVKATSATLPSRMNLLGNQDFYFTAAWNAECVFFVVCFCCVLAFRRCSAASAAFSSSSFFLLLFLFLHVDLCAIRHIAHLASKWH